MKKIKILETIRQGQVGGGETHVLELCTHLNKAIYEPVVLSFTDGPMVDELNRRGIRTKIIKTTHAFDFRVWKQVKQFIDDENFDIVHAHGTRAMSNIFWATKKLSLPLIYTVHGWSFHLNQSYPVRRLRELSEKFLTSKADSTICVSISNQQDGIDRFGLVRSSVIYNAVDCRRFNPANTFADIRAELGIAKDAVVIGYIVRITAQKDPFTMLRAMKRIAEHCPKAVLLMVGDGDLKQQAIHLAKELKIESKVVFQGFRSDIPDVLNAIDIYCLPSLWEGFPIGILEAMAMRKVVVASPVDGTRELIEHGKTGLLVEHGKPIDLANTIMMLADNINLRNALASTAQKKICELFSVDRLVKEVQQEYLTIKNTVKR